MITVTNKKLLDYLMDQYHKPYLGGCDKRFRVGYQTALQNISDHFELSYNLERDIIGRGIRELEKRIKNENKTK